MSHPDEAPPSGPAPGDPPVAVVAARPAAPVALDDTGDAEGPCPQCGLPMNAIRGSKQAICPNCGFKDSCCF